MRKLKSALSSTALASVAAGGIVLGSGLVIATWSDPVAFAQAPCAAANPCAAKNPCAATNPCAAGASPGGAVSGDATGCRVPGLPDAQPNPCAAKAPANPCAANPCAAKEPPMLSPAQAQAAYDCLINAMREAYGASELETATAFFDWPRYNAAPYLSDTHGSRYVNNYANEPAYGRFETAGVMPVGTVVAKDSFEVAADGTATAGPLFLMEKREAGFHPPSGDWRYTLIMPDGTLAGTTKGPGHEAVEFCIGCHKAAADQDSLFFMPAEARIAR